MQVKEIMSKEEFPVVDKVGKLVGMVGIFDIIQAVFRQKGIISGMIFTAIVATTVVYELIGLLCTKYALYKAGEISPEYH